MFLKTSITAFLLFFLTGCFSHKEANIPIAQEKTSESSTVKVIKTQEEVNELFLETLFAYYEESLELSSKKFENITPNDNVLYELKLKILDLLNQNADVNYKDYQNFTPLYLATINNDTSMAKILLDKKADKNTKTPDGNSLLLIAIKNELFQISEFLIDSGFNPNGEESDVSKPLELAIKGTIIDKELYTPIAIKLLKKGANPNLEINDESILILAIKTNNTQLANELINSGADLGVEDKNGLSAVNLSILYKNLDIANILTDYKELLVVDSNGFTPISLSSITNFTPIYQKLKNLGLTISENDRGWASEKIASFLSHEEIKKSLENNRLTKEAILAKEEDFKVVAIKNFKDAQINYKKDLIVIESENELIKKMFLKNPNRLVFDFTKKGGSINTKKTFINAPFSQIAIGNHYNWYRIVINIDEEYKPFIEIAENKINIKLIK